MPTRTNQIFTRFSKQIGRLICLFIFLFTLPLFASTITGKVIRVIDGDTIVVLQNRQQYKIRFYGIDTPEKRQAYGQKAKQYLSRLIFGKTVKVEYNKHDRYGRIIGKVYLGEKYINFEMIKAGYAWWYRYFARNEMKFKKAEEEARKRQLGLWKDKNPVPPWEWRRRRRNR